MIGENENTIVIVLSNESREEQGRTGTGSTLISSLLAVTVPFSSFKLLDVIQNSD